MKKAAEDLVEFHLIKAKLLPESGVEASSSLYCTITVRARAFTSKVHQQGGATPTFNDKFSFEVGNVKDEVVVKVWDQGKSRD